MKGPLDVVRLRRLINHTSGGLETLGGLLDGPVPRTYSDLANQNIQQGSGNHSGTCANAKSVSCPHGTLPAGPVVARRGSVAPRSAVVNLRQWTALAQRRPW